MINLVFLVPVLLLAIAGVLLLMSREPKQKPVPSRRDEVLAPGAVARTEEQRRGHS